METSFKNLSVILPIMNEVLSLKETISRIEDDVEVGLEETKEAHVSMEQFYEISKGNRSLIIKVFLLLAFFIVLFLVWT